MLRRLASIAGPIRDHGTRGVSMKAEKKKNLLGVFSNLPMGRPKEGVAKQRRAQSAALQQLEVMSHFVTADDGMRQSTLWRTLEASGAVPAKVNNGESDFRRALFFRHSGWTVEEAAVAEYWACRNKAAVWDMSSFVKFRIEGPDAARELERLCTLRVDRPVEDRRVVYCCLCNEEGGVEADVTVLREGPETFYMVVGAELLTQTQGYLARHLQGDVTARAVSDEVGVLCVAGPLSRSILTHATNAPPMAMSPFANEVFPFGTWKLLEIGGVAVKALRVNFMGDLGWELHCDMADLPRLYDAVMPSAYHYDVYDAGYACLASLRTEKMFLHWGATPRKGVELTAATTPLELGFPVKKTPFIASEALERQRVEGVQRRLVSFVIEGGNPMTGHEALFRNGEPAGMVCTAAFSHSLGKYVGIGWVEKYDNTPCPWKWVLDPEASYTVEDAAGERRPCKVGRSAPFDSQGVRMRS